MAIQINAKSYSKEVEQSDVPVLVDFYADWCMPCRMMAPVFDKLGQEYKGSIKFVKVNVDEEADLAGKFGVMGIPTLVLTNKGKEISRVVGFAPESALKQKINEALEQ